MKESSQNLPPRIVAGSETTLPVLPLRDVVVFPHMVIPLFVGRKKSIRALELAMEAGKQIMLAAQKSATDDDPATDNIHTIGTIASILQLLKLPDGTVKVLVEGERRAMVQSYAPRPRATSRRRWRYSNPSRSPTKRARRWCARC